MDHRSAAGWGTTCIPEGRLTICSGHHLLPQILEGTLTPAKADVKPNLLVPLSGLQRLQGRQPRRFLRKHEAASAICVPAWLFRGSLQAGPQVGGAEMMDENIKKAWRWRFTAVCGGRKSAGSPGQRPVPEAGPGGKIDRNARRAVANEPQSRATRTTTAAMPSIRTGEPRMTGMGRGGFSSDETRGIWASSGPVPVRKYFLTS